MATRTDRLVERVRSDPYRDPWKRRQYERLATNLRPQFVRGDSVIDVGCGEGVFTESLAAALSGMSKVLAMDITPNAAWTAPQRTASYVVADAATAPFRRQAGRTVVAKDLLHHMDDPIAGVQTLVRLAVSEVVIVEANEDNPLMAFYARHNGDRHMTRSELAYLLEQAVPGLRWDITGATAYPFYLPPVKNTSAVWVWPLTGLMLLLFKVGRSDWAERALNALLRRLKWPPPFNIAVCREPPPLSP